MIRGEFERFPEGGVRAHIRAVQPRGGQIRVICAGAIRRGASIAVGRRVNAIPASQAVGALASRGSRARYPAHRQHEKRGRSPGPPRPDRNPFRPD